jgi:hypothetical protein
VSWFSDDKTWAGIGKLETLLAILAAIVGVYSWASESKPELVAYGWYSSYSLPPDLHSMLVNIRNSISGMYDPDVQKLLTEHKSNAGKVLVKHNKFNEVNEVNKLILEMDKQSIDHAIETLVRNIFYDTLPLGFRQSADPYDGFLQFNIGNVGGELDREVTLSTPFDGIAHIVSENGVRRSVEVKRSIEIGSIRQNEFVRVYMWSTETPELKHEDFLDLLIAPVLEQYIFLYQSLELSI